MKLKKRNTHLTQQLIELEKVVNQLQEAKIKIETHFVTLHDQLKREELERKDLTRLVPLLQEASTLIDRYSRVVEVSGAQQTLKHINNLMHDQTKNLTAAVRSRKRPESTLSILSDGSSIAESYTAEEEVTQSTGIPSFEKNKAVSDIAGVPVPDRHISTISTQETERNEHPRIPNPMTTAMKGSSPTSKAQVLSTTEFVKETHLALVRSESTPTSDSRITHHSHTPLKKTCHYSVPSVTEQSFKSQGLKHDYRVREQASPGSPGGSHAYLPDDQELQNKLTKRRIKIESQSEYCEQHSAYQSP